MWIWCAESTNCMLGVIFLTCKLNSFLLSTSSVPLKCFSSSSRRFNLRLVRFFGCLGPLEAKVHLVRPAWRSSSCLGQWKKHSVFCCTSQHRADVQRATCSSRACSGFHSPAFTGTTQGHLLCACLGISMGAHLFCWKVGAKTKLLWETWSAGPDPKNFAALLLPNMTKRVWRAACASLA